METSIILGINKIGWIFLVYGNGSILYEIIDLVVAQNITVFGYYLADLEISKT